jgi:hypothetical protein
MDEINFTPNRDRLRLAPRPATLAADAEVIEQALRAIRLRLPATEDEAWRLLRACDALAAIAARIVPRDETKES